MDEELVIRAFLVGPTGVGKTDVALIVARRLGLEIVNIDSRQIYRRLEIGTAKPTSAQRRAVVHHLIDRLEPTERCSAGRFLALVREVISDLRGRGARGLAVGGAGLYVDACLGRFHPLPPANPSLRAEYERAASAEGEESLHERLAAIDPATARRLHPKDRQRVIRALEVAESTGRPLSAHHEGTPETVCPATTPVVYLTRERRDLYARIEARCRAMVAAGLPEEVRGLIEAGIGPSAPGLKSVGYAEWVKWGRGECDREEAMDLFVRNSRRYAKRQETWFRNRHPGRIEFLIPAGESPSVTAARVLALLPPGAPPAA